jgi:hypothetical protein
MKSLTKYNPLSVQKYISLGNDYQKTLSNNPTLDLPMRIGSICGKLIGRLHDIALNILFGIIKLTVSTALALYSVPAAAFNYVPKHHVLAKQGSRHIALALLYVLDIPLSLANIVDKYPQAPVRRIQNILEIENSYEEIDTKLNESIQGIGNCEKLELTRVNANNEKLRKQNQALLEDCIHLEKIINTYKQILEELSSQET